jgi:polysaccharide biosynthesis/export protein
MKKIFVYLSISLGLSLSAPVWAEGVKAEGGKEGKTLTLNSSVTLQGYRLRNGDQIRVDVFDFPELSKDQTILPDGTINVLYVGPLRASGKTPEQLSNEITSSLSGVIRKPIVSVSVAGTRPLKVNVVGEVGRPGPQTFNGGGQGAAAKGVPGNGAAQVQETITGALSLAGGVTPLADMRNITLIRPKVDGSTEQMKVDFWQALQSGDFSKDLPLNDGDTIKIGKLADGDVVGEQMAQTIATSTLAPQTVQVQVAGEVKKAGVVNVDPRSTLLSAIYEAGGPTTDADIASINVARLTPSGKLEKRQINLNDLNEGKVAFQVRSGDLVFVGRKGSKQLADDVGTFLGPLGNLGGFVRLIFGGF